MDTTTHYRYLHT